MKITTYIKLFVSLAFASALTALLLINSQVGAQDRAKPPTGPPSSFGSMVEEPLMS